MDVSEQSDNTVLRRLFFLFVFFTVTCLFAGASRMSPPSWQLQPFGDVLRIREALSMFLFAPMISVFFWLLTRCVGRGHLHLAVQILMVLSVYFVACGMGMHDPVNRMQVVYRNAGGGIRSCGIRLPFWMISWDIGSSGAVLF